MADQFISNPDGAFGYTALADQLPSKYVELECSSDVSAGYVVGIGTTGKVAHCSTVVTTALGTKLGVAANSAKSASSANGFKPGIVKVITEGYAEVAMVGAQTASTNAYVVMGATTAGVATSAVNTTAVLGHAFVGRLLADDATTTLRNVKCWVSAGPSA